MKDIKHKNSKGKLHGHQEMYSSFGTLWFRAYCVNNNLKGYVENHSRNETQFFIR